MPKWIQDPETGTLIPAHEYRRNAVQTAFVQGDIESFRSPVDGSLISDRAQLREHNHKHGVTDLRDYGDDYFARKEQERQSVLRSDSKAAKQDRIATMLHAIETHGGM